MARTLTIPEDLPDALQQAITKIQFFVIHVRNAGNTAMEIDKTQSSVKYEVTTYDSTGKIISVKARVVMFNDWPIGFKTDMTAAYAKLELDATNEGLFYGPGADEPLE